MISYAGTNVVEIFGLSTDEKPLLEKEYNGSTYLEIDTGKRFSYDAENKTWIEKSF